MNWLARLLSPRRPESAVAPVTTDGGRVEPTMSAPPAVEALPTRVASQPLAPGDAVEGLLSWLLNCPAPVETPISPDEQRLLALLDKTLALPTLPDELLPRAAALIPQLLALLRQTDLPVPALAQKVAKDPVLAAEVLRLASSPFYRAQGEIGDLAQAIALIGVQGLQTVIARVVLKPMYGVSAGGLSALAAPRLWEHAEALARHTGVAAHAAGLSVFDGYLAGLLHDSGWTIALRLLDRHAALALPPSAAFAAALEERAHRLFGRAAERWAITPGFTELGADARACALAQSQLALAAALRGALAPGLAELRAG